MNIKINFNNAKSILEEKIIVISKKLLRFVVLELEFYPSITQKNNYLVKQVNHVMLQFSFNSPYLIKQCLKTNILSL